MMKTAERNVVLQVKCVKCNEIHELNVTEESAIEYAKRDRRHVQEIFPYLNADERELLISKICPKCWDEIFSEDEDYEEDDISPEDYKEWVNASCGLC